MVRDFSLGREDLKQESGQVDRPSTFPCGVLPSNLSKELDAASPGRLARVTLVIERWRGI